jgi:hypothetical protein
VLVPVVPPQHAAAEASPEGLHRVLLDGTRRGTQRGAQGEGLGQQACGVPELYRRTLSVELGDELGVIAASVGRRR